MTDRFSPSLPINGKVKASLVRRVADVVRSRMLLRDRDRRWRAALRAALTGPALVLWRFDYGAIRLGIGAPHDLKPVNS